MAFDNELEAVAPIDVVENGTIYGTIKVSSVSGFRVHQQVLLKSNAQEPRLLLIKTVVGTTLTLVDMAGGEVDLSSYLVADGATIEAPVQRKPPYTETMISRSLYENAPIVAQRTILVDSKGNHYGSNNPVLVALDKNSIVADGNSTSSPLPANQEFVGEFQECLGYSDISVVYATDQSSEVNGVVVEWSTNGVDIDHDDTYTAIAPARDTLSFGIVARYFRIRFLNGNTDQSYFRLQTIFHTNRTKSSTHRIADQIDGENDAELVKAVLTGQQENSIFSNVGLSNSGSMKVAVTDRPSEVRNRTHVDKNIEGVSMTATPTVTIHTVTPGKTFYLTSLILSSINEGNATGRLIIRDGGVNKIPFVSPKQVSGAASPINASSPPLPEPIPFTTSVVVTALSGNITASVTIVGYEE